MTGNVHVWSWLFNNRFEWSPTFMKFWQTVEIISLAINQFLVFILLIIWSVWWDVFYGFIFEYILHVVVVVPCMHLQSRHCLFSIVSSRCFRSFVTICLNWLQVITIPVIISSFGLCLGVIASLKYLQSCIFPVSFVEVCGYCLLARINLLNFFTCFWVLWCQSLSVLQLAKISTPEKWIYSVCV